MRNKRLIIAALAAVLFGLVAVVSISRYLANIASFTAERNRVVVAKVDIPVGHRIAPEQLEVAQFPGSITPDGTYATTEKLAGRVAVTTISMREPITENKLAPEGALGGLSSVIPEGYRAMTVKVDEVVGVSGFLVPGTLVDVVVVIEPPQNSGRAEKISKIVLQNIKVLASGQNIDKPKNAREPERGLRAVTLQVTPEQTEKLALAASEGRLQLVLRNSIDQGDEQTPGANKTSLLLGERALPVPEPATNTPAQPVTAQVTRRPRPRVYPIEVTVAPKAVKPEAAAPAPPPRPSIEVIEGAKKRSVDFP